MYQYETLVEALQDLDQRGYQYNFNLAALESQALTITLLPTHFRIVVTYRFEGISNPDDNAILYAIESDEGLKGVLVNAYGMYSNALSDRLVTRLPTPLPQ